LESPSTRGRRPWVDSRAISSHTSDHDDSAARRGQDAPLRAGCQGPRSSRTSHLTVHGRPSAVLIAVADLEALQETLSVLSDPETLRRLVQSDAELARGEVVGAEELAESMAARRRHTARVTGRRSASRCASLPPLPERSLSGFPSQSRSPHSSSSTDHCWTIRTAWAAIYWHHWTIGTALAAAATGSSTESTTRRGRSRS
jgi:antitoxin YefM